MNEENATTKSFDSGNVTNDHLQIPPTLLGHPRYRILEILGRGGMSTVYKAEQLMIKREVALKVVSQELTRFPSVQRQFTHELAALGRLVHPNIVRVYDADKVGDLCFLVMEYVKGINLSELVTTRGPLPISTACRYICQVALALEEAHRFGHVHCDIKPQNLRLTPEDRVKVMDFGLAHIATDQRARVLNLFRLTPLPDEIWASDAPVSVSLPTQVREGDSTIISTDAGMFMGTPDYMAPEQLGNPRRADPRSDIYSLGCTFYYLLTGRVPFPGGTIADKLLAHQHQAAPRIAEYRSDVRPATQAIVDCMMAKNPEDRFQTAQQLAEKLTAIVISRPPTVRSARQSFRQVLRTMAAKVFRKGAH
jgi:serine/threonine protein kinase